MEPNRPRGRAAGVFCALAGGCLWGFSGSCGQYLFQNKALTSDFIVPWRLLLGGVLLLLFLCARRGPRAVFAIWRTPRHARALAVFGVFGMTGCQYTYLTAIQYSNAGTATVLQYLSPTLIMLLLCLRGRRWPTGLETFVVLLDLAGIFLIATHGDPTAFAMSPEALFWGLLSAVFAVLYTLAPGELLARYEGALVVGWGMLLGGVVMMVWKRPWTLGQTVDGEALFFIALIILLGSIAAFTLYLEGVKRLGPGPASLLSSVEPVSAALIAVTWLGVRLTVPDVLGFVCILLTVLLLALRKTS